MAVRIPWHLIYIDPVGGHVDPRRFLGARILVLYAPEPDTVVSEGIEEGTPDPMKAGWRLGERPSVGHVWDDAFLSAGIDRSRRWDHGLTSLHRDELPPLSNKPELRQQMDDDLMVFVIQPRAMLHLDCHGAEEAGSSDPSRTEIGIRQGYKAKYSDLRRWRFTGNPRLLAQLNVCHAGHGRLLKDEGGVAERLIHNHLGAVIAPTAKISFDVAMSFSKRLYEHLTRGDPVLEAFERTQTDLFNLYTDPQSGQAADPRVLAYSLFGELQVVNTPLASVGSTSETQGVA